MSPLPNSLLESVAAAAVREGLADALYTRLKTPIGRLLVVSGPEGVVRIAFESEAEDVALAEVAGALGPRVIGSDRELAGPAGRAAARTSTGEPLDLPVDLRLARAPFRHAVLEQLREVPRGQTVSYGELAARAGNPQGRPRRGHGVRAQPGADRRALPPRAPGHGTARELPGRAGAQGRAPGAGGAAPR